MDNKKMNAASLSEKYSVLMSVYYKEDPYYLECSIMSMIEQTLPPDQIILVEDGPLTDELNAVITKLTTQYPSLFTLVINEENLGLGKSLAKGLLASKNEIVARMDTDDISVSNRCESQLLFLAEHQDVAVVGGQIEEFIGVLSNKVGKRIVPCDNQSVLSFARYRCPFNHMTVMFRKSSVLEAGNYRDCFWNEDYYLWIRMILNKNSFANLPEVIVNVRIDKDMYKRRGGKKYFKSEVFIQKLLLENKMISLVTFHINVFTRWFVQVICPNSIRQIIFRTFARE